MNTLKLSAEINGATYVAECQMPDLRGYSGRMSTYSGLHGSMSKLLWKLAESIESGASSTEKSDHWVKFIGG